MRVVVAPKEAFELPSIESHCLAKGSVASLVVVCFDATSLIEQIPARSAISLVGFAKTSSEHVTMYKAVVVGAVSAHQCLARLTLRHENMGLPYAMLHSFCR